MVVSRDEQPSLARRRRASADWELVVFKLSCASDDMEPGEQCPVSLWFSSAALGTVDWLFSR